MTAQQWPIEQTLERTSMINFCFAPVCPNSVGDIVVSVLGHKPVITGLAPDQGLWLFRVRGWILERTFSRSNFQPHAIKTKYRYLSTELNVDPKIVLFLSLSVAQVLAFAPYSYKFDPGPHRWFLQDEKQTSRAPSVVEYEVKCWPHVVCPANDRS